MGKPIMTVTFLRLRLDSAFLYPQAGKILHLLWILKVLIFLLSFLMCCTSVEVKGVIQPHFMQQCKSNCIKKIPIAHRLHFLTGYQALKVLLVICIFLNSPPHFTAFSHPAFAHHAQTQWPPILFLGPASLSPTSGRLSWYSWRLTHSQPSTLNANVFKGGAQWPPCSTWPHWNLSRHYSISFMCLLMSHNYLFVEFLYVFLITSMRQKFCRVIFTHCVTLHTALSTCRYSINAK